MQHSTSLGLFAKGGLVVARLASPGFFANLDSDMIGVAATRDDNELLRQWRSGDKRAGSELFGRHFDELYGFFRNKVASGDLAEDLVQQTMLACVRNRDGFRGDSSFRTYLFTIARSRLIDMYRRRGRSEVEDGLTSLVDPGQSPSTWFRDGERKRILIEALSRLSFDHQLVLELHYVRGFKGPELAKILEVPEGTIRSRLRRARAALAHTMSELSETGLGGGGVDLDLEGWAGVVRESAGMQEK
jgi:RNA polymerase sigma factor (sigma-70 family)